MRPVQYSERVARVNFQNIISKSKYSKYEIKRVWDSDVFAETSHFTRRVIYLAKTQGFS